MRLFLEIDVRTVYVDSHELVPSATWFCVGVDVPVLTQDDTEVDALTRMKRGLQIYLVNISDRELTSLISDGKIRISRFSGDVTTWRRNEDNNTYTFFISEFK